MRVHELRQMRKDYSARRRYDKLDRQASQREVKAYRVWRRRWMEAIERHVRMKR